MREWHQAQVKKALHQDKKKDDLVRFRFSRQEARELEWVEAHEFRYNGYMFDVVHKTSSQDSVHILAFRDEKETRMMAGKEKMVRHQHQAPDALSWPAPSPYLSPAATPSEFLLTPSLLLPPPPPRFLDLLPIAPPEPPPCSFS